MYCFPLLIYNCVAFEAIKAMWFYYSLVLCLYSTLKFRDIMYCFPLLIYNIYDCLSYFHVFCLLLDPFARTLAGLA